MIHFPTANRSWIAAPVFLVASFLASATQAGPSAIVEDIEAAGSKLAFMDYVEPGDVVQLAAGERLVLGYFASCTQETIVGGTITVGLQGSEIAGGNVRRVTVPCDTGQVELGEGQTNNSGVVAFRSGSGKAAAKSLPALTIHGLSPLVRSEVAGTLTIERVDQAGAPIETVIRRGANDLATRDITLAAGGLYRARLKAGTESHEIIFDIDAFAEAGDQPKLSRLIRF
ncbi:MAG: hypothetical protein ABJ215_13800 [Alphaproteobacteria bacterium]